MYYFNKRNIAILVGVILITLGIMSQYGLIYNRKINQILNKNAGYLAPTLKEQILVSSKIKFPEVASNNKSTTKEFGEYLKGDFPVEGGNISSIVAVNDGSVSKIIYKDGSQGYQADFATPGLLNNLSQEIAAPFVEEGASVVSTSMSDYVYLFELKKDNINIQILASKPEDKVLITIRTLTLPNK